MTEAEHHLLRHAVNAVGHLSLRFMPQTIENYLVRVLSRPTIKYRLRFLPDRLGVPESYTDYQPDNVEYILRCMSDCAVPKVTWKMFLHALSELERFDVVTDLCKYENIEAIKNIYCRSFEGRKGDCDEGTAPTSPLALQPRVPTPVRPSSCDMETDSEDTYPKTPFPSMEISLQENCGKKQNNPGLDSDDSAIQRSEAAKNCDGQEAKVVERRVSCQESVATGSIQTVNRETMTSSSIQLLSGGSLMAKKEGTTSLPPIGNILPSRNSNSLHSSQNNEAMNRGGADQIHQQKCSSTPPPSIFNPKPEKRLGPYVPDLLLFICHGKSGKMASKMGVEFHRDFKVIVRLAYWMEENTSGEQIGLTIQHYLKQVQWILVYVDPEYIKMMRDTDQSAFVPVPYNRSYNAQYTYHHMKLFSKDTKFMDKLVVIRQKGVKEKHLPHWLRQAKSKYKAPLSSRDKNDLHWFFNHQRKLRERQAPSQAGFIHRPVC